PRSVFPSSCLSVGEKDDELRQDQERSPSFAVSKNTHRCPFKRSWFPMRPEVEISMMRPADYWSGFTRGGECRVPEQTIAGNRCLPHCESSHAARRLERNPTLGIQGWFQSAS